ncbi:MAG: hypothetical protein ACI9R3_005862 [Verrucomicrobiales bacterium]|jgi:hypothetical protein
MKYNEEVTGTGIRKNAISSNLALTKGNFGILDWWLLIRNEGTTLFPCAVFHVA